ncbi:unnamed protein product [Discosporangium mesarthrocarpum]
MVLGVSLCLSFPASSLQLASGQTEHVPLTPCEEQYAPWLFSVQMRLILRFPRPRRTIDPFNSWFPLLPRKGARLMTVFGKPIVLPTVSSPSDEDVHKWHAVYKKELHALFDRHKGKYASNPRGELELW